MQTSQQLPHISQMIQTRTNPRTPPLRVIAPNPFSSPDPPESLQ